jgi:uncharacterized ferritin-like protein (DUF455 family)
VEYAKQTQRQFTGTREAARAEPIEEIHVSELRTLALQALGVGEPEARCLAVDELSEALPLEPERSVAPDRPVPGRPARPRLVPIHQVPARNPRTAGGHAALLHSIAHIEFNAIGLALDAIWRFAGLPPDYYRDWLRVAQEETRHFRLLSAHLATLGHAYGDFDAHDGLWDMAARTAGDVLDRMALVPRRLEARGLDVSPGIRSKLIAAGDPAAAAILDIILRDEIGHVAIGNRWFNWLCSSRGLDPVAADARIALRHRVPRPRGPFNLAARRAAGFSAVEIDLLDRPQASARAIPSPD